MKFVSSNSSAKAENGNEGVAPFTSNVSAISLPPNLAHNTYNQFVSSHDDLIGLIAYSLYKQQKIDFLTRHREEHGEQPSAAQVNLFCSTFRNPLQVEMLKNRADDLLRDMTIEVLRPIEEGIKQHYEDRFDKRLKQGPGFWFGVRVGVMGNIAFAALLALLLFVVSAADKGLAPAIASLLGYEQKIK